MLNVYKNLLKKMTYSTEGLKSAYKSELSLRQWVWVVIISDFSILFLGNNYTIIGAVYALGFLLLAMELVNTSIEILTDFVHPEHGEVAKKAKDIASGAVLLTSLSLASLWVFVIAEYFLT